MDATFQTTCRCGKWQWFDADFSASPANHYTGSQDFRALSDWTVLVFIPLSSRWATPVPLGCIRCAGDRVTVYFPISSVATAKDFSADTLAIAKEKGRSAPIPLFRTFIHCWSCSQGRICAGEFAIQPSIREFWRRRSGHQQKNGS